MIVCVALGSDGSVGGGWGRADRVAVARVSDGAIASWEEFDVGWGKSHDAGPEGQHHARIARFLMDHAVETIVTGHIGPGMVQMLAGMKITARTGATGPARAAAVAAAQSPR
jgi:predicted Fe-Mo cluster-binding NifX family protein